MDQRAHPALRYAAALVVMAFFGATLITVVSRDPGRLGEALLDAGLGFAGLGLLHWRHRRPFAVALVIAVFAAASTTAFGPAFVAFVSLTTHRRFRQIAVVGATLWVGNAVSAFWRDGFSQVTSVGIAAMTLSLVTLTITGLYVAGRRDLAEAEARRDEERLEQARLGERVRIAREMHDVLAHRLSLLSLHAGALAHRTDLTPAEVRAAAAVIQENAHQSLDELRATLGVLRAETAPQPSFDTLGTLFTEVRAAGQQVTVTDTVRSREVLPVQAGRHAYRIVQEGLTNARKHAPGAPVTVALDGGPGADLRVTISNPAPASADTGEGVGLVGLSERMAMIGGSLSRRHDGGRFVLDATLPWEVRS
ncbi:sensor histidine kinase [Actinoplanes friuliensis]|uniref:histidine kinase n=1 Tax=Actinoplanes friuliensis DSM 7358 TaxID=1246995 RepID=U5WA76_9ACTN|nr:histidine kinase [Actinoplanes friuliensis]AGZ44890.1 signal transduction histidine kinase-like protein [Actinoplanes friuliensis DSM 7358]